METFVVSALKYRPSTFDEVVGQEGITRTLQNSLETNQLAQALLFCGPRGVGKTSCARILAKQINSAITSIDEDSSFNVFELDAASNNSVEDIRKINDQVRIPPQIGTHKIYIIDEAHMLSTSAFNAFLKTLEEPPKHAIFILATTEKNKIIPTVLSRCQVYDFKRISIEDIKNYLIKIATKKNWKLEFDFGNDKKNEETGEIVDFAGSESLGACPKCGGAVHEHGSNYVCEKAVPTEGQPTPTCNFKSGKIVLQQVVEREQIAKLLSDGKTDLLEKFVSNRTRRAFKAFLSWNAEEDKVVFEFEPRKSKFPPRKTPAKYAAGAKTAAGKTASKAAAKTTKAPAKKAAAKKTAAAKTPRKAAVGNLTPSADLAAVIGTDKVARTEVVKKLWDYIKAQGLQDPTNKRAINADAKLKPVFGKDQITMFELAGLIGKHLS